MYQLYYQPEGIWVGDIMPYGKEGQFYVYHQRDTRNPGPFLKGRKDITDIASCYKQRWDYMGEIERSIRDSSTGRI